jgi:myosin heavy subunit
VISKDLFSVVAFVLHLGDLTFMEDDNNHAQIDTELLAAISKVCN